MDATEGLVRRNVGGNGEGSQEPQSICKPDDLLEPKLTLMEEVLLLAFEDKQGHTSFWNDSVSMGLRACIIVELGLRGRVVLEPAGMRRKKLLYRKLILKDATPTGDALLDETIKHLKETAAPETVDSWIRYLSGDSWNPLKLRYQLKKVRERLAKNLVEKGVLTTDKKSYFIFQLTTHPLSDSKVKCKLVKKIQDAVLTKWVNDHQRFDERVLALIFLGHVSEALENAFANLNDRDYDLATKRVRQLLNLDLEEASEKTNSFELLWAAIATFSD